MKRYLIICTLVMWLAGCAGLNNGLFHEFSQSRKLSMANGQLAKGENAEAIRLLTEISDSKGVAGVTDEALFRLALLSLGATADKDGIQRGEQLLKRLRKEYPSSPWSVQSAPLLELLTGMEELRKQNRNFRNSNQNLSRENRELNQMIERLKRLDQELEKKSR